MVAEGQKKLSVGIIGTGGIVTSHHLPVLLAMDNVNVAWLLDSDASRSAVVGKAYRVKSIAMPDPLTNLPEADVVVIATPYGVRMPYYEVLRSRETALYVEKPLARTAAEHREICSWFPDYRLACGLQRRSFGPTHIARAAARTRLFGSLREMRFGLGRRGTIGSGTFMSNPKLAAGGRLIEEGIHGVDTMLFLADASAARVLHVSMIREESYDLHTEADLQVETADGTWVDVHLMVSYLQDTIERLDCIFEHGTLSYSIFSTSDCEVTANADTPHYSLVPSHGRYPKTSPETGYEYWSLFLAGLIEQKANWTSASASILTTQVIEDIYSLGGLAMQENRQAGMG